MFQLEALSELAGACIGIRLAWVFAEGRVALDVDQATALLVSAVLSSQWGGGAHGARPLGAAP